MRTPTKPSGPTRDLSFKVSEAFQRRMKLEAILRQITMRQLLEDAVREYLERHPVDLPEDMR